MWRSQEKFMQNVNKYCSYKQVSFVERAIWQKSCKCHTSGIVPTPYVECREDVIDRRYNIVRASVYAVPVAILGAMGYPEPLFAEFGSVAGILWGSLLGVQAHAIISSMRYNIPFFSNNECCAVRSFDIAEKISAGIKNEQKNNHDEGMKWLTAEKNIENIEKHIKK